MTAYGTRRLGFTADAAGFYGSAPSARTNGNEADIRQYSFMGGPQVRLFRAGRFSSSVPTIFGAAYGYVPDLGYGGKGHNPGRLQRHGFRIPRGGVILAPW